VSEQPTIILASISLVDQISVELTLTDYHEEVETWPNGSKQEHQAQDGQYDTGRPLHPHHPKICTFPWLSRPRRLLVTGIRCGSCKPNDNDESDNCGSQISRIDWLYNVCFMVNEGAP
jgi:hypothetical protein